MYGQQTLLDEYLSTLWGQWRDAPGASTGGAPAAVVPQPDLPEQEETAAKAAASQVQASVPVQSIAPPDAGLAPVVATSEDDTLWGGDGNDSIIGLGGDDTIHGGDGDDTIRGNSGHDNIYGDGGDDVLYGGAGKEDFWGGEGNDTIYGNADQDIALGGGGDDRIWAGTGDDIFAGEDGDDVLYGEAGDDSIWGGENRDTIYAGNGDDRIEGDGGDDTLYGGGGRDQFIADAMDGNDVVADFNAKLDRLLFRDVYDSAGDALAHATQQGKSVVFDTGGGNSVTVLQANLSALNDANVAIW